MSWSDLPEGLSLVPPCLCCPVVTRNFLNLAIRVVAFCSSGNHAGSSLGTYAEAR